MSIDWDNAPEGAEYYDENLSRFYKSSMDDVLFIGLDGKSWIESTHKMSEGFSEYESIIKRPQHPSKTSTSNGLTADYYELPASATQLQDLISFKDMNAQVGESFRSLYRYGQSSHSDKLRDAKKVVFYMNAEIERLEKYG